MVGRHWGAHAEIEYLLLNMEISTDLSQPQGADQPEYLYLIHVEYRIRLARNYNKM